MNIAVICAHLPAYLPLAALTIYKNRMDYCRRHGYHLLVKTDGWKMPAAHPVSWDRLQFMRDELATGRFDWAYCCGADTLHTNFRIRLEDIIDPSYHVIIAPDWCAPVQADSFLVRNSPEGIGWLDHLLSMYPTHKDHPWVENQAMIDCLPQFRNIIKIVPQRVMNAYDYRLFVEMYPGEPKVAAGLDYNGNDGQWQPGDFLIHWPSLPLHVRIAEVKKTIPLIVL